MKIWNRHNSGITLLRMAEFNFLKNVFIILLFIGLVQIAPVTAAFAVQTLPPGITANCVDCHDDYIFKTKFSTSVHGNNGCISCHTGVKNIGPHMRGEEKAAVVACGICHKEEADEYGKNVHYLEQKLQCGDCHRDIHSFQAGERILSAP